MAIAPVTRKHAAIWPGSGKRGSGTVAAAICGTPGQRGAKLQPRRQAAQIGRVAWDRVDVALARLAVHSLGKQARGICRGGRGSGSARLAGHQS